MTITADEAEDGEQFKDWTVEGMEIPDDTKSSITFTMPANDVSFTANYEKILVQIKEKLPETQVYMMAYYPVKEDAPLPKGEWGRTMFKNRNNTNIPIANEEVKKLADKFGYTYIDVNNGLTDVNGNLKEEYTIEGVHMYANAYRCVLENLKQYL